MNQKILMDSGFKLDITDGAIIDFINSFVHSEKVHKMIHLGKTYYWISYGLVANELPILDLKRDTLYRKFKAYIDMGLLDAHPENKQLNRAYFAINHSFMGLFYTDEGADLGEKIRRGYGKESLAPTEKNPPYNTIKDNSNKDKVDIDLFSNLPFKTMDFFKTWEEWTIYRKAKRKPIKTERLLKEHFDFLKDHSEVDAIKILQQSIDNSWTGLFELKGNKNNGGGGNMFDVHI